MINKLMERKGYNLIKEDKYGVVYHKKEAEGYTHVITLIHKKSGKNLVQSFDGTVLKINNKYINEVAGIEVPVLLLMWIKAKTLPIKYRWCKK